MHKRTLTRQECGDSCGTDILNRLLLAIERDGREERHRGPILGQHNVSIILFWMLFQTSCKLMILFKKKTYSICSAWSLISFNVKIIYLPYSIPDVTVEGTLIYIPFSCPPVPICTSFLNFVFSLGSSPIHIVAFICCVNRINRQCKNPYNTRK